MCQSLRLAKETGLHFLRCLVWMENFDSYEMFEKNVPGFIDFGHASTANAAEDSVFPELLPNQRIWFCKRYPGVEYPVQLFIFHRIIPSSGRPIVTRVL